VGSYGLVRLVLYRDDDEGDGRMGTARGRVAAAAALVALTLPVALAAPAGAATPQAPAICARVQTQYTRIVAANTRAKNAFEKASTLRSQLNRNGRARLGQRLNTRLAYLQSVHAELVARVAAIAARVQGRCPTPPPSLPAF
jgi:hypothetical protein